ncbi:MAG: pyruvate kinase [Candidatus Colwellbacteria bacterium]|jgi:pyruvate kinase|nr:pyruvate kinase [Candidatus Colwellbacteria bacterium]MCK9497270.1 pyruvate kinase [Candidatus Colwellbacteria bacterium]MDD3752627.1 pyruvate kinase [Candidatus Colwellbacteria bacterium]MDD4818702.1 pyruvate kinase [Candidatus Colwellbacteria bacterium]
MRTKIIATIGPKSESPEMLRKLVLAGMDIARMNFSHCTYDEYLARKEALKKICKEEKRDVKILLDLKGPRLRVGELPEEGRELYKDEEIIFSTNKDEAKDGTIFIEDPHLHKDINVGDPLFLTNGAMELVVTKIEETKIFATVLTGGILFSNKAVNVPMTTLTTSSLTNKDIDDIQFGLEHGMDYVALSFVQTKEDVERLRALVGDKAKIISKIERPIAVKNIDTIIQASDAVMIARGDLGIEMPMEDIPTVQKHIIEHAAWNNIGSIVATQMLLSMIDKNHPTRAEVSDVANAVFDGADAVMLSDETATGDYPVEAVEFMAKIVRKAEKYLYSKPNHM